MEPVSKSPLPWSIKICGITRVVDAVSAVQAGADAIGLNFYSRSLRFVPPETAASIVHELETWKVTPIGVFVNHSPSAIRGILDATGIKWVQLHGNEFPEIAVELEGLNLVRVIRIGSPDDFPSALDEVNRWKGQSNVHAVLIDAPIRRRADPGDEPDGTPEFGGTGKLADWATSRRLIEAIELPVVMAGGLDPENVASAIAQTRPAGVDVASGVEGLPGQKNSGQVQQFVSAAKAALGALQSGN